MIIITGATGHLGQLIVEELLVRLPAMQIGASTRSASGVGKLIARGVRARQADFNDRASLDHAFSGATQVLIISSNAVARGEDPIRQHRAAIEAAKAAGTRRVLYTSHMGASSQSKFPPMRTHAATEELLAQSGIPFTVLRNGFYAESALQMLGEVTHSHEIVAPQDGPVCWTTHEDLAAAAAIILTNEGQFEGATPPLTARATLDLSELGSIISDLTKGRVARRVISDEDFHNRLIANGTPEHYVPLMFGLYQAARQREFDTVDPTLENLLDREPISMHSVLKNKWGTGGRLGRPEAFPHSVTPTSRSNR